ncbi:MAG: SAP domain-containing protein [Clostridium sp.]
MSNKPILDKNLSSTLFRSHHYIREDLISFCKSEGLQSYGNTLDLTEIIAYFLNTQEKKKNREIINRQFEYNNYIQAFFIDNKDKSLADAHKCWNYKKSLTGHNRYEKKDLNQLK